MLVLFAEVGSSQGGAGLRYVRIIHSLLDITKSRLPNDMWGQGEANIGHVALRREVLCDISYGWTGRLDHVEDNNSNQSSLNHRYVRDVTVIFTYIWQQRSTDRL